MTHFKHAVAALALVASLPALADVTVGQLSRASGSDLIVDSLNQREWLGFDVTKGLTYAQTVAATGAGGRFEGFRIAHNQDAAMFGQAMAGGVACAVATTGLCLSGNTLTGALVGESFSDRHALGYSVDEDMAFFLSDNGQGLDVGVTVSYVDQVTTRGSRYWVFDEWNSFLWADHYADYTVAGQPASIGWLLYRDPGQAVPEPSSALLAGLGLMALFTRRAARRRPG